MDPQVRADVLVLKSCSIYFYTHLPEEETARGHDKETQFEVNHRTSVIYLPLTEKHCDSTDQT